MATAIRKFSGTGSPEGVVSAPPGSTYIQTDGASGSEIWDKATGTGNTGWRVRGSGTGGSTNGEFPDPVTITSNTTADIANYLYLVNAASGAVTLTLPTAVGNAGKEFVVKKIDSSTNIVTIDASGSQTIDGALTLDTATQHDAVAFQSDGANWYSTTPPSGSGGGSTGGSGNISGAYDIEAGTYTDAGMSDEFTSGTLDAQWTTAVASGTIDFPGQPGSARYDLASRSGTLLLQPQFSTSAAQTMTMRVAGTVANGESLVMSCALPFLGREATTAYTSVGFVLNSSTTSPPTGTYNELRVIRQDTSTSSGGPAVQAIVTGVSQKVLATDDASSSRIYLRVTRKTVASTDTLFWMYSVDGVSWTSVFSNTATAFTQLWIQTNTNTQSSGGISPVYAVNWIRHVASTAHDLW